MARKARRFSLGVMISPRPQQTMAAFIMGPKIFVRELHLPVIVLQAWLRAYSPQIGKFARKLFQLCPPSTERPQLCLCLKEFFTETWRMIDIKSRHDASPVAVGWKAGSLNDRSGSWTLLEMAHPTSVVSGGVSNYNVLWYQGEERLTLGWDGMGDWERWTCRSSPPEMELLLVHEMFYSEPRGDCGEHATDSTPFKSY